MPLEKLNLFASAKGYGVSWWNTSGGYKMSISFKLNMETVSVKVNVAN